MNGIFLLLGSNKGDRLEQLQIACGLLKENGIRITDNSSVYETQPWGNESQAWFLNAVVKIETNNQPEELLAMCLQVELEMGRVRTEKWGERTIDIDILYFHDTVLESPNLYIPHPGIPSRKFTLIPLVEMSGGLLHPQRKVSQLELLANCDDPLEVKRTKLSLFS